MEVVAIVAGPAAVEEAATALPAASRRRPHSLAEATAVLAADAANRQRMFFSNMTMRAVARG